MQARLPIAALVIALPLSVALIASSAGPAEAGTGSALASSPAGSPDGALDGAMQKLQAGMQRLGKALDKKDAPASLGIVIEMQAAAAVAKLETPPKAEGLTDAAKKTEFVQGFRKQMIELQRGLLDVETALIDGKTDEAKKAFDERVKAAKKTGHDTYKD